MYLRRVMKKIQILIADGQYLTRLGLKCLFNEQKHVNIIGEVENEKDLLRMLSNTRPDLVILDYHQQKDFSIESIRKITALSPTVSIMLISGDNNRQSIYQAIENGISSFLTKSCDKK